MKLKKVVVSSMFLLGIVGGYMGFSLGVKRIDSIEKRNSNLMYGSDSFRSDSVRQEVVLPVVDTFKYEFPWLEEYDYKNTIVNRVGVPENYERLHQNKNSFEHWLQHLPLKKGHPDVLLYDGTPKWNQSAHLYVFDIDVGDRDLQQCADALMRLRAEYLYGNDQKNEIHFNYTNGAEVSYTQWRKGLMPIPQKGGTVKWVASSKAGEGYAKFKKFLIQVFNYAGTYSLNKELASISFGELKIGDMILQGGFPAHGIVVVDMAVNEESKDAVFLLAQSYMPAQEIQILRNFNNEQLSPWYSKGEIDFDINTPEWYFDVTNIKRWN